MITLSGRRVLPGNDEFPSLTDVAIGLARIPRFGGQLRVWPWTVAHHSLLVHEMATAMGYDDEVKLAVLVHDFHEAVTGDVVTSWKPDEMRTAQAELDRRLWFQLGESMPPAPGSAVAEKVAALDRRALIAEGSFVARPGWLEMAFPTDTPQPQAEDVKIVSDFVLLNARHPIVWWSSALDRTARRYIPSSAKFLK